MISIVKVTEVLEKTSFDGKDGKVTVQPIIVANDQGVMFVELYDKMVTKMEDQKIVKGSFVSIATKFRLSSFESKNNGATGYINHIECINIFNLA